MMSYEGEGVGKQLDEGIFWGRSEQSFDNAIRAAVGASNVESGTRLAVAQLQVETTGDPNVGAYLVIVQSG
jgi:hypothetical protein